MNQLPALRVLMIGCGNIAGGFDAARPSDALPYTHAGAYLRHGGFSLDACIDPDDAKRRAFAARWNIALHARGLEELAPSAGSFDVVSICSPTDCHEDDLMSVVPLRPKLIFCEKPVSLSLTTTERLVKACIDRGILLAVNHTRRWAPDIRRLHEELASGAWGAIRSVHAVYNKGILNNGSHLVDLLALLFGPLTLASAGARVHDYLEADPTIPAVLQTASGLRLTLGVAHAADYACFELSIVTERGVIQMEDGGQRWRLRRVEPSAEFAGYTTLGAPEYRAGEYAQAMTAAVTNVFDALAHGASLASNGKNALDAQALCEAIAREAACHPRTTPTQENA